MPTDIPVPIGDMPSAGKALIVKLSMFSKISLKITHLKFSLNLPGANELSGALGILGNNLRWDLHWCNYLTQIQYIP